MHSPFAFVLDKDLVNLYATFKRASSDPGTRAERKHADLLAMMNKWWKRNGLRGKNSFDAEKFWAYGCHCVLLGSQPITQIGHGAPKDDMDQTCRVYKDCHRCVRGQFGERCNGELKKYNWKWSTKESDFISANDVGSCARSLFECDKSFVYGLFQTKNSFDKQYHWYSGFEALQDENCVAQNKNGFIFSFRTDVNPQACCGGRDQPYIRYSRKITQCCTSGVVKNINEKC